MPLLAGDVINDARDLHPTFDDNTHPDAVMVRALNRGQQEIYNDALTRYPSFQATIQEVELPLDDFDAGVALEVPIFVADVTRTSQNEESPLDIIPYDHRFDGNQPYFRCWIMSGTLYLAGPASLWSDVTKLTIRYSAECPDLVDLESTLVLPDSARSALVAYCAQVMAARGTQRTDVQPASVSYFGGMADRSKELFLTNLWLLRSANVRFIRDVGP